jgi:hypothetical protein
MILDFSVMISSFQVVNLLQPPQDFSLLELLSRDMWIKNNYLPLLSAPIYVGTFICINPG